MHLTKALLALGLVMSRAVNAEVPCTNDPVSRRVPGEMACYDSDGWGMGCDECFGRRDGYPIATRAGGAMCIMFTKDNGEFRDIACPGDPAPSSYPDGTPFEGIAEAFCSVQGGGGPLGFPTQFACWVYALVGGNAYEQNKAGLTIICDALLVGLCTYIDSGAGNIGGGGSG